MKSSFCASVGADGTVTANGHVIDDCDGLLVACDARMAGGAAAKQIVAAWRRWGADCAEHLYGDYAFFLHDRANRESFCARDHIGSRPLFYVGSGGGFACASDIPTLLALPDISHELDEDFIAASQLERFFEPGDGSFYRAIRRLPAGHCLHRSDAGTKIWRWWQPETLPVRKDIGDAEAVAETRALLKVAIAERLEGAGKVALHLSGGIDSSLVASLVVAKTKAEHAYCWQDLTGTAASEPEAEWIEAIANQLELKVASPKLSVREMAALLARDWARNPDARNLLHEAAVQKAAAQAGVTTIFSGWGGDEGLSFHGRGHKPMLFATGRWLELLRIAETPGLRGGLAEFYSAARRLARDFRPRPFLRSRTIAASLVDPAFARRARPRPEPRFREFRTRPTQLQLLQTILTSRIEDWAISGADHGIEYVYPLLDRALLEYVVTLPPRMFVRAGGRRWLVREVARGLIPELIRLNSSKNEAARGRQLHAQLADAYREIALMLEKMPQPPSRAKYLDMTKVRQRLERVDRQHNGADRRLRLAIQLLDLDSDHGGPP